MLASSSRSTLVQLLLLVLAPSAHAHWYQDGEWLWINHRGPFVDLSRVKVDSFAGYRMVVEGTWGVNHLMDSGNGKQFFEHFFAVSEHPLTVIGTDDGTYWWSVVGKCNGRPRARGRAATTTCLTSRRWRRMPPARLEVSGGRASMGDGMTFARGPPAARDIYTTRDPPADDGR